MSDRMSHKEWETLKVQDFERLEAEITRLTQQNAALAMALAQLREACLEDIGGRHEEIQCALCLRYWPIAGPPQHDATCILAADQPAAAGAELLKAADELATASAPLAVLCSEDVREVPGAECMPWVRHGDLIAFADALNAYRRARAGQRGEGPAREGES